jgi:uncharacterized protein (TIGR03435 family)
MRNAAVLLIRLALLTPAVLGAQSSTFEAASIRRNVSTNMQGSGLAGPQPGGRFIAVGVTLRRLVDGAYDGVQVVGGPAWVDNDRFDINARASGDVPPSEIVRMVRSLLTDRFKLVLHTETREMPVYVLTTSRSDRRLGPKLRESDAKCAQEARNYVPQLAPGPPPCGDFRLGARALTARGMTMARFAGLLRGRVDRPVFDRTDFTAAYDLELEWSSDLGLQQAPPGAAGANELTPEGLSLFTALQEQLGLKLDATRGPVDVLVIDSVEPPTSN